MCGICGIFRPNGIEKEHVDIFNKIFEQSEQRGSDAFGFYTHPKEALFKQEGKVTDFLKKHKINKLVEGNKVILGHTRATTNGTEKKNRNNHPWTVRDFALAHNGMIWNHQWFREKFKTDIETDSIMILKLIQDEYEKHGNVAKAIGKMAEKLRGSYACWLLFKKTGSVYFFRHDNPIYLGYHVRKDMYAFASDRSFLSFLEGKIREKLGFKGGLAYASIEENTIYRLTKNGLNVMGRFKPMEYDYSNQGTYYGGKCDSQAGTTKLLESPREVFDPNSFRNALWDYHDISFNMLAKRFDYYGISFNFEGFWAEIIFSKESAIVFGQMMEAYGLTISPKSDSIRIEYPKLMQAVLDINESLEEEF